MMLVRALALAAAALLVLPAAPAVRAAGEAPAEPQIGAAAPEFALKTADGRTVTLDAYRGKTLVLNAWATWCPPCRQETPDLIAAYRALHAENVEFLGVDSTESAPIVRAFVAAKGVPYPEAIDAGRSFVRAYGIRYFPTTFVIDPQGVLRARYIDVISPVQVRAFVAAARSGRDADITSPLQAKIDALLAPAAFAFDVPASEIDAVVARATAAIAHADELADESDPAHGRIVDLTRVRAEQAALRDRAIAALAAVAATPAQHATLARLQGDAALDRREWDDALARYDDALRANAGDRAALEGAAAAALGGKRYARAIDADRRLAALEPTPDAYVELGEAYKAAHDYAGASAAYERALALARGAVDARPHDARRVRKLAFVYLYAGRLYAAAGERAKARAAFTNVTAWTEKLPKTDDRYAMYLEEAQEATVALDLSGSRAARTTVSLAPWTGPDLPGSVASTIKYRLVVGGAPGSPVALTAAGLPKGWIASFCTDRVCAPFRVDTTLPASGVKVVEFQVVPDGPQRSARPTVRVTAHSKSSRASAAVLVAKGP